MAAKREATDPSRLELPGRLLSTYEVEGPVGQGAMGVVLRARHKELDRPVAIKVLRPRAVGSVEGVSRFADEAGICARMHHPNVVHLYDFDMTAVPPYLVFEYVDGERLDDWVAGRSPLALPDLLHVLAAVADGLAYAHAQGVVHRDLKPENVLVTADGVPKVTDFGLAKAGAVSQFKTRTGVIMGTPTHISPEQAQGLPATAQSDVYALGVIVFELVAGRRPFEAPSLMDLVIKHVKDPAPPLRSLVPDVPAVLDHLVARCLEKQPADRPQGAAAVAAGLRKAADATGCGDMTVATEGKASRRRRPDTAVRRQVVRHRRWFMGVTVGAVVLAALVVVAPSWLRSPPARVDDFEVLGCGSRGAVVAWYGSWSTETPDLVVRSGKGGAVPMRLVECLVDQRAGPSRSGLMHRHVALLGGLEPETVYTVALRKPDGTTTLTRDVRTAVLGSFEPVVAVAFESDGTLVADVRATRPFRFDFTPATWSVRQEVRIPLAGAARWRGTATSVDGEGRTYDHVGALVTPFLHGVFAAYLDERRLHANKRPVALTDAARALADEYKGQTSDAGRLRVLAQAHDRVSALLRRDTAWYPMLAPVFDGFATWCRRDCFDGATRQALAEALVPLSVVDGLLVKYGLADAPWWQSLLAPASRPWPTLLDRSTLTTVDREWTSRCRSSGSRPYAVFDAADPITLDGVPEIVRHAPERTFVVDLGTADPSVAAGAEMVLRVRSTVPSMVIAVEVNDGAFTAYLADRRREAFLDFEAWWRDEQRVATVVGWALQGLPETIATYDRNIADVRLETSPVDVRLHHGLPPACLRSGENVLRVTVYHGRDAWEGLAMYEPVVRVGR